MKIELPSIHYMMSVLRYEDFGSPEESLHEGADSDSSFHSSPEYEDMDFNEGIENPNGLNIEDVNENILDNAYDSDCENVDENVDENSNGNPLEKLGTNQQVMNGIKLKDIKGPQPSREELEVELNTTKKQNQVLESRVEALQAENNNLKGRVGSIEAQMERFEDMMMNQLNVNPSSSVGRESSDHLFFDCRFSREILQNIKQWLSSTNQTSTLGGLFKWINKRGNKNNVYKAIWNAATTTMVYSIWKERNGVIHGSPVSDMQQIIQKIKFWVKEKVRMINKSRLGAEKINWLDKL
ncbi:Myocilin [Bienertia sinuspersici]